MVKQQIRFINLDEGIFYGHGIDSTEKSGLDQTLYVDWSGMSGPVFDRCDYRGSPRVFGSKSYSIVCDAGRIDPNDDWTCREKLFI
jgi:hypothetical protein